MQTYQDKKPKKPLTVWLDTEAHQQLLDIAGSRKKSTLVQNLITQELARVEKARQKQALITHINQIIPVKPVVPVEQSVHLMREGRLDELDALLEKGKSS